MAHRYERVSPSQTLDTMKSVYHMFAKGGSQAILYMEICNLLCSIFMYLYGMFLVFYVDWNAILADAGRRWVYSSPRLPECSKLCKSVIICQSVATGCIIMWGIYASAMRIRKARRLEKTISDMNSGCVPTTWEEICTVMAPVHCINPQRYHVAVGRMISAEKRQLKSILAILRIDFDSTMLSRYLVWSIQNALSISSSSLALEESSLDNDVHRYFVNAEESTSRIKCMICFLLVTSPFFVIYYSFRILVKEFYKYKSGNPSAYTWSFGSQFYLQYEGELPDTFEERLKNYSTIIETLKKSEKNNIFIGACASVLQFIVACLLLTALTVSVVALEEGRWNENVAGLTAALSALILIGVKPEKQPSIREIEAMKRSVRISFDRPAWKVMKCYRPRVYDIVCEIAGILIAPYILLRMIYRIDDISIAINNLNPTDGDFDDIYMDDILPPETKFDVSDEGQFAGVPMLETSPKLDQFVDSPSQAKAQAKVPDIDI